MGPRPEGRPAPAQRPSGALKDRASAQAALALVESLILTLIEQDMLSVDDAVEVVEIAIGAKRSSTEGGDRDAAATVAAGMLSELVGSVRAARPAAKRTVKGPASSKEA